VDFVILLILSLNFSIKKQFLEINKNLWNWQLIFHNAIQKSILFKMNKKFYSLLLVESH